MKFLIYKFLLTLTILLLALVGGVAYYGVDKYRAPSQNPAARIVVIPKGAGSLQIAEQLKREKIISDTYVFVAAAKFMPPKETLKAGEYEFLPNSAMADVITKIKDGDIYTRQFTIPEGLTSFEIIEKLREVPELRAVEISVPAEGTLLPDTYQYAKDEALNYKVLQMQDALKELIAKEWPNRDPNLPFSTVEQALTLASIIEKETGIASERKRIAGVFVNRLRQGIPLQSDPTVIYALTNGQPKNDGQGPLGRRLLLKDLEIDSPFNTYKNVGLPPMPIANAGRDAILAALHPEQNNFLFFVADGTGGHVFAATLAEHNQNVAKWRQIRTTQAQSSTETPANPVSK